MRGKEKKEEWGMERERKAEGGRGRPGVGERRGGWDWEGASERGKVAVRVIHGYVTSIAQMHTHWPLLMHFHWGANSSVRDIF